MHYICKLLLIFLFLFVEVFSANGGDTNNFMMKADEVYYNEAKEEIHATGNIFVTMDGYNLNAKEVRYDLKQDIIFAEGNIHITTSSGEVIQGQQAILRDKLKAGVISEFIIKFDKDSLLVSRLGSMLNKNRFTLEKSVFTPCKISCDKSPIWQLKSKHTEIDYTKQNIVYKHLFFELYGVPIIYLPYLSHPMHDAEAQSGILVPKMKNDSFMIPAYFRVKPNLDFTITPRIANNYTIFNGELRHAVEFGKYEIHGSYGNPRLKKASKDSRPDRYYFSTHGDFSAKNLNYGFDINRASDKAYLTNYHEIYDSYLTSRIYANRVNARNYFLLQGFYFQDMRVTDLKNKIPLVLPNVQTKNIYNIAGDNALLLNVETNTVAYRELDSVQLFRTSVNFDLMQNIISRMGHVFDISLSNRGDLYFVDFIDQNTDEQKAKSWYRNIPEISGKWSFPLVRSVGKSSDVIKLEPTAMVTIGRKYESRFDKFGVIDSSKNELSENNIFDSNRFSGIDFHEYGTRMSYGITSSLMSENFYINSFLGQSIHKYNVIKKDNADYVGNLSVDIFGNFEFFYRFRKDHNFKPIRNETGADITTSKLTASTILTELYSIGRYFASEDFSEHDKISQLDLYTSYNLTNELSVKFSSKLDLTNHRAKTLMRTIGVTYKYDCVSISASVADNFLHDIERGIRDTGGVSITIGLKAINM